MYRDVGALHGRSCDNNGPAKCAQLYLSYLLKSSFGTLTAELIEPDHIDRGVGSNEDSLSQRSSINSDSLGRSFIYRKYMMSKTLAAR